VRYEWNELPREVLGEGIVINVDRNASTMVITFKFNRSLRGRLRRIE